MQKNFCNIYTIRLKTCKKKMYYSNSSVLLLNGSNNDGTKVIRTEYLISNLLSNLISNTKSEIIFNYDLVLVGYEDKRK